MASRIDSPDPFGAYVERCKTESAGAGDLADVRVAVKDNIAVEGMAFSAGLSCFAERRAESDAAVVVALRAAGAIVNGVCATDLAGFGVTTPAVTNPVMSGHVVGGSSGGSAAAVAAGYADIGLGTDTGGSVRIPAVCCGISGFKPSHGSLPLEGVWPMARSFDAVGVLASDWGILERTISSLLRIKRGLHPEGRTRIGIDRERLHRECSAEIVDAIEDALLRLPAGSFDIHSVRLPDRSAVQRAHATRVLVEALPVYAPILEEAPGFLPAELVKVLQIARRVEARERARSEEVLDAAIARTGEVLTSVDVIVTPTLPVAPPLVGQRRVEIGGLDVPVIAALTAETVLANVTGGPAVSIPTGGGSRRFVGLQLIGARGADQDLLRIGAAVAAALGTDRVFS